MQQHRFGKQRHFRRAVLQLAVMADNQVLHQHAQLGREIGNLLELFVQQAQPNHNVPEQLPFGAVAEAAIIGQFGDLADVVQERRR